MSSPPVPVVTPPEPPKASTLVCANCHAELGGEYCAACGQRNEPHLHTVAHFASEAFESISHADSRLWKTLWYLVSRPGYLTREFFEGRRVSYLPPFRLYLVISVFFFIAVGLPDSALYDLDDGPATEDVQAAKGAMKGAAKVVEKESAVAGQVLDQVAESMSKEGDGKLHAPLPKGLAKQNAVTEFCDEFKKADPTANQNYESMRQACRNIAEDNGAGLGRAVVHNIPKAMFVFLPLLALAMKPLYLRPKRYYVEHLLFLIHNHAFIFLVLGVLALLEWIPVVGDHLGLLEFALWVYICWYLYRGMRNVYHQGRALTLAKYFTVGLFYFCAALTVLILTAVFSAFTLGH